MKRNTLLVDELIEMMEQDRAIYHEFETGNKWNAIRLGYKIHAQQILERGHGYGIDPYFLDWGSIFTPIEFDAWCSIRYISVPLYPQYPVGNVFVDFGDPVKKVALECDGKEWHTKEKDRERDKYLESLGWIVFRVTGAECHRTLEDIGDLVFKHNTKQIEDDEFDRALEQWSMTTSDGVIHAISGHFYKPKVCEKARRYFFKTLQSHTNMSLERMCDGED